MELPTETVLATYGIVRDEKNSKLFYCSLCTDKTCFQNWKKHINDQRHVLILERSIEIFENKGNKLECKICTTDIERNSLMDHAKYHRIIPWHRPSDLYQILFRNYILEWNNQFYCCLCRVTFPEWSTAYLHITNSQHQPTSIKTPPMNRGLSLITPYLRCDVLVSNGIFPCIDGTDAFKCAFHYNECILFENVVPHIKSEQHSTQKTKFTENLSKIADQNQSNLERLKDLRSLYYFNGKEPGSWDRIVKLNPWEYWCQLCNAIIIDHETVADRLSGNTHSSVRRHCGCDNIIKHRRGKNYCKCCNCKMMSAQNVHAHIKMTEHMNNLPKSPSSKNDKTDENSEETDVSKLPNGTKLNQDLYQEYILDQGDKGYFCAICDALFSKFDDISEHVTGKRHQLNKTHCCNNKIMFIDKDFYCIPCRLDLSGISNVRIHFSKGGHLSSLRIFIRQAGLNKVIKKVKTPADNKNSAKVKVERIDKVDSNWMRDFFLQLRAKDHRCRICNVTLENQTISRHITSKEHICSLLRYECDSRISLNNANTFLCNICDCMSDRSGISVHVKGENHHIAVNKTVLHTSETKEKKISLDLPCIYIVEISDTIFCCKICDVVLESKDAVHDHIRNSLTHYIALKHYGSEYIHPKNDFYYCDCCKCKITSIENVHLHLKDFKHRFLLAKIPKDKYTRHFIEFFESYCSCELHTNEDE